VKQLILARHGEAGSNAAGTVSGVPPGADLTALGREQGRALESALDGRRLDLGVATQFARTQETLAIALSGRRDVGRMVMPELNEIRFGAFDGGSLETYREWAWTEEPDVRPPGDGESRSEVAERVAGGLDLLLARTESVILVVSHALPVRYVLDAADGTFPAAKIEHVEHAKLYPLDAAGAARAAETLRVWATEPVFRDLS
jgi:ribonuclease H / adenosylcobalamin/alpha-ribazole phosphatase